MNDKSFRWYHYLMTPIWFNLCFAAVILVGTLFQLIGYEINDNHIEVYKDVCQVELGGHDDDFLTKLTCDGEIVSMKKTSVEYLHTLLTTDRHPVIICTKTISEYLNNTRWACEIDPEESTL